MFPTTRATASSVLCVEGEGRGKGGRGLPSACPLMPLLLPYEAMLYVCSVSFCVCVLLTCVCASVCLVIIYVWRRGRGEELLHVCVILTLCWYIPYAVKGVGISMKRYSTATDVSVSLLCLTFSMCAFPTPIIPVL